MRYSILLPIIAISYALDHKHRIPRTPPDASKIPGYALPSLSSATHQTNLKEVSTHQQKKPLISHVEVNKRSNTLEITLPGKGEKYSFNSCWLWIAHKSASRRSLSHSLGFSGKPHTMENAYVEGNKIVVKWGDEKKTTTYFPDVLLRVYADQFATPISTKNPITRFLSFFYNAVTNKAVAPNKTEELELPQHPRFDCKRILETIITFSEIRNGIEIVHIPWRNIMSNKITDEQLLAIQLMASSPKHACLIKVTELPSCKNPKSEATRKNGRVTQILERLFQSAFDHPRRGRGYSFNVISPKRNGNKADENNRASQLQNYDTDVRLPEHCDHAHYLPPNARSMALYCTAGESYNTFVNAKAVALKLKQERPDLYELLTTIPVTFGRYVDYYEPHLWQQAESTIIEADPFTNDPINVRWHPFLSDVPLSAPNKQALMDEACIYFANKLTCEAFEVEIRPGDMYLFPNGPFLHGRNSVTRKPRILAGQTSSAAAVDDAIRLTFLKLLKPLLSRETSSYWFIHFSIDKLVKAYEYLLLA